jgi:hypothetical protein
MCVDKGALEDEDGDRTGRAATGGARKPPIVLAFIGEPELFSGYSSAFSFLSLRSLSISLAPACGMVGKTCVWSKKDELRLALPPAAQGGMILLSELTDSSS